jgi:ribonuclease Z
MSGHLMIQPYTTPREAGMVFERARPKLAAYTHIVRLTNDTIAAPTIPDMAAETRQTYKGPLVIGEDLMTFDIGDGVCVSRRTLAETGVLSRGRLVGGFS